MAHGSVVLLSALSAYDPLFYGSEESVFDRYDNLSGVCDALGATNWSSTITDRTDTASVPAAGDFANFRNAAATRRLCQIAAARIAWGTPCYAQTWHHCVQHDDDPALNVFPPQEPRCEWSLAPTYMAPFAHGCTSGRSLLHPPAQATGMNTSCDSVATCRLYQHGTIPAAATGLPASDASFVGYAPVDAVTTFNPKWDLHCRNGGVRAWSYTSDDFNSTMQMTEGNIECACPPGWEGVECAQCSSNASCSLAGYGVKSTCDRGIGAPDDAPLAMSCKPIEGTKLFFESITRTKTTFNNVHASRKRGTVRISALGQTDFPWNNTAYIRSGWVKDGAANSSGFLQNPTSFHMVGSSCTSERRAPVSASRVLTVITLHLMCMRIIPSHHIKF